MMIDRIIAYRNTGAIQWFFITEGTSNMLDLETSQPLHPAAFPMIQHPRHTISCTEFIIRQRQVSESQLILQKINEPQSLLLRSFHGSDPIGGGLIDQIQIDIIAMTRPIDHVFFIGQLPVRDHFLCIHVGGDARLVIIIIGTRSVKFTRIVANGTNHCTIHPFTIIFQYRCIGNVLNDVIRRRNIYIFPGKGTGLHPYIERNTGFGNGITQFGSIDQLRRMNGQLLSGFEVTESGALNTISFFQNRNQFISVKHF